MASFSFEIDDSDMQRVLKELGVLSDLIAQTVAEKMANTIRALSQNEVPLDVGTLQGSVVNEWNESEGVQELSYNTDYAAYQHEGVDRYGKRVVKNWQHGRKKKYLEDPIKNNLSRLTEIGKQELETALDVLK